MDGQALHFLFEFTRQVLAPIGNRSHEQETIVDAIALGRLDLVGNCLRRFISRHHDGLSLGSASILLQVAQQLEQGKTENLLTLLSQVAEGQRNLGFLRNRAVA